MTEQETGPTNSLLDVAGLRVGHHTARGPGQLTGTTAVLAPAGGALAGVDVRGGGPGTHETDLLDPRNAVDRVNAVVLCGGSAFGLVAAHGIMERLAARGEGVAVGADTVVPIVPAAAVFDLGRGGATDASARPNQDFGAAAYDAALAQASAAGIERAGIERAGIERGSVGAGTGAVAGGLKGGLGTASAVLADGTVVAALTVVNAAGSALDPATGKLYGQRHLLPTDPTPTRPSPEELAAHTNSVRDSPTISLNTTLGVVATDATLPKARCAKIAGVAHDGLARAINPVHSMFDGDTVFCLATGTRPEPDQSGLHALLATAADCMTRAVVDGLLAATSVHTSGGGWLSYRDTFPSAAPPLPHQ